ncbi:unnamed protein product [Rangifer tarandus platyrhynchus]|uniref:Uncharacterized protein n=1 Tax=Rangifer tarandus platyrhynchus TaxID=3082113 RepID=A0ACB1MJU6_RANTA
MAGGSTGSWPMAWKICGLEPVTVQTPVVLRVTENCGMHAGTCRLSLCAAAGCPEKLQPEGDAFSCRPVTVLSALGTCSVPPGCAEWASASSVGAGLLTSVHPGSLGHVQSADGSVRGQGDRSRLSLLGAGAGRLLPEDSTVRFGRQPSFPGTCRGCQPQVRAVGLCSVEVGSWTLGPGCTSRLQSVGGTLLVKDIDSRSVCGSVWTLAREKQGSR